MKAISLWQPWASAMASGVKRNETRSWSTSYRGDLLICSAKRKPTFEDCGDAETLKVALTYPYGCALCIVELYACVPTVLYCMGIPVRPPELSFLSKTEEELGDYSPSRFAWLTRNLRKIEPVPIVGHQGLWDVSATWADAKAVAP